MVFLPRFFIKQGKDNIFTRCLLCQYVKDSLPVWNIKSVATTVEQIVLSHPGNRIQR